MQAKRVNPVKKSNGKNNIFSLNSRWVSFFRLAVLKAFNSLYPFLAKSLPSQLTTSDSPYIFPPLPPPHLLPLAGRQYT